jgi:pantetheine-phosphate adenylyltransferase
VGHYYCLTVDHATALDAQVIVRGLRVFSDFEFEFRMALTNRRLTPEVEMVSFMTREEHTFLSSTTVKEVAGLNGDVSSMVPPHVREALLARFARAGGLAED